MHLRSLEIKDAPLMFGWMHDENVVHQLNTNFAIRTLDDCKKFIIASNNNTDTVNLAIASDTDEYMGTVSLKYIDKVARNAEFSIIVRSEAMGHGYAWYGMEALLDKAFEEYGLDCVYWCISRKNERACRFFTKHNFHEALDISKEIVNRKKSTDDLIWYSVLKGDVLDERETVAGCRVIHIKTIPTVDSGELSFFESNQDIPFEIKRVYYISKVPEGVRRGFHAHKSLKQLLFCPFGRIQLVLENKNGREEIELSDPSIGVVIENTTWREMLWLQKDSVLCVAASDYYQAEDYIRSYSDFEKYINDNTVYRISENH